MDYDPLVERTAALKRTHEMLQKPPPFVRVNGLITLQEDLFQAEELRKRKSDLIERFKADFPVLRNSLAYFPEFVDRGVRHSIRVCRGSRS